MAAANNIQKQDSAAQSGPVPSVSIVSPCYNGGRHLDQLLASLAQQTFQDFEIIIVDDGSTDETTRAKLASLDAKIRVIRQDNQGLSGARNTGIAAARAEYVLPLDCDDVIEPSYLAETVPRMRSSPPDVAVVFTHTRMAGSAAGVSRRYFNPFDLLFNNTLTACILLRKSCWSAVGGYDTAMRDGYEDWEFYIRLARAGFSGIEIAQPLFVYYLSASGMLLNKATRVHGALWRYMRGKHASAYRLRSILPLWWSTRNGNGELTLVKALAIYALAVLLPDFWFNRLVVSVRNRRLARRSAAAIYSGANGMPQSLPARRAS